jgi:hypothetical protein
MRLAGSGRVSGAQIGIAVRVTSVVVAAIASSVG